MIVAGLLGVASLPPTAGCRTERSSNLGFRRVHLSAERPTNKKFGVTLLRVEPNGTVVVQRGSEIRLAIPHEPSSGFLVEWSDSERQAATMLIPGCWPLSEYYIGPFRVGQK